MMKSFKFQVNQIKFDEISFDKSFDIIENIKIINKSSTKTIRNKTIFMFYLIL